MNCINKKKFLIKNLFYIYFTLILSFSSLYGATRGDVKVIESSENIRYLSQKLVKEYLLLYKYPKNMEIKNSLEGTLEKLNNNFKVIAKITKNSETKDMLDFLAYSKDKIVEIFEKKLSEENCALMLDYSEILIEGVNSIEKIHAYKFSKEEQLLMLSKKMEYLIERINKHYMAIHLKLDSVVNKQAMNDAIIDFEKILQKINKLNSSKDKMILKLLHYSWQKNKILFKKTETIFVPNLMGLSLNSLENIVSELTFFYSKNQ